MATREVVEELAVEVPRMLSLLACGNVTRLTPTTLWRLVLAGATAR
jgi:hypothetical protein